MRRTTQNRQFILSYYEAISGVEKTMSLIGHFTADPKLIDHVLFFEKMFPSYQVIPDEITTEGDRVIVQGRRRGNRSMKGEVLPTEETVEIPFAMGYRIEDQKIVDHWFITDRMELFEQLNWI
jgi:predicted ester cyclase